MILLFRVTLVGGRGGISTHFISKETPASYDSVGADLLGARASKSSCEGEADSCCGIRVKMIFLYKSRHSSLPVAPPVMTITRSLAENSALGSSFLEMSILCVDFKIDIEDVSSTSSTAAF